VRKFLTIVIPFLLLTACVSFPVVVDRDQFKGETIVTADMWHTVVDSGIDNLRALYRKEIKNGAASDPTVTFVFVAVIDPYYYNYNDESLKPEAYVVVDDTTFKVNLIETKKLAQRRESVTYDYITVAPRFYYYQRYPYYHYPYYGYSYYPYYYPYSPSVVIRPESRRILTAKLRLTPEIQSAIVNATKYMIRFYVGDNPLTLEATPKQLASVKKFLLAGAGENQAQ